jgi:hypothetical protein
MPPPRSVPLTLLALLLGAGAALRAQEDADFQARARFSLRWAMQTNWTYEAWTEMRWLDDAGTMSNWRVGQRLHHRFLPQLTAYVGYTYIRQDGFEPFTGADLTNEGHRFELAATPGTRLAGGSTLQCRLQSEWTYRPSPDDDLQQIRVRPEWILPLNGCGPLREFRSSNEFFLSLADGEYRMNRAIPVSFGFALGAATELRLQYVLDSIHLSDRWVNAHAFQTRLIVTLR